LIECRTERFPVHPGPQLVGGKIRCEAGTCERRYNSNQQGCSHFRKISKSGEAVSRVANAKIFPGE
jgi:hypothetical protein